MFQSLCNQLKAKGVNGGHCIYQENKAEALHDNILVTITFPTKEKVREFILECQKKGFFTKYTQLKKQEGTFPDLTDMSKITEEHTITWEEGGGVSKTILMVALGVFLLIAAIFLTLQLLPAWTFPPLQLL